MHKSNSTFAKDPVVGRAHRRCCVGAGVAIAGASLIAAAVLSPAAHIEARGLQLISGGAGTLRWGMAPRW